MDILERPCCGAPLAVELPLAEVLTCGDCAVAWEVADPAPVPAAVVAIAA